MWLSYTALQGDGSGGHKQTNGGASGLWLFIILPRNHHYHQSQYSILIQQRPYNQYTRYEISPLSNFDFPANTFRQRKMAVWRNLFYIKEKAKVQCIWQMGCSFFYSSFSFLHTGLKLIAKWWGNRLHAEPDVSMWMPCSRDRNKAKKENIKGN